MIILYIILYILGYVLSYSLIKRILREDLEYFHPTKKFYWSKGYRIISLICSAGSWITVLVMIVIILSANVEWDDEANW
jgi:uncharacterized membrane protein